MTLGGCEPNDHRPALWLQGEIDSFPTDVSFADAHREIALQVSTPHLLPHSAPICSATVRNRLDIGASEPETKNCPQWAAENPEVRLQIGERLFKARLEGVSDQAEIARIQRAYARKYDLDPEDSRTTQSRYWRVEPRSSKASATRTPQAPSSG